MESKRIYRNSKNHWNIKYLYIFHLDIPARQRRDIFWFWWLRLIFRLWPAKAPETHHPTIAQHKRCALQWIKSQINSKNMKCKMWWVSCCDMSYFQSFCIHMQNCPPIPRRPFMSEASNWLLFQRSSWLHTLHFKNGSLQLQHFTQKGLFFFNNVVKCGMVSWQWCLQSYCSIPLRQLEEPNGDRCQKISPVFWGFIWKTCWANCREIFKRNQWNPLKHTFFVGESWKWNSKMDRIELAVANFHILHVLLEFFYASFIGCRNTLTCFFCSPNRSKGTSWIFLQPGPATLHWTHRRF